MSDFLRRHYERWKTDTLAGSAEKMPEQPERTVTASGRPVETVYWPEQLGDEAAQRWTTRPMRAPDV